MGQFVLNQDSLEIQYLCKKDKRLAKIISMVGDISYSPYTDGYAFLIHEIIEQMLSIKAGAKIYERLLDFCGGCVTPAAVNSLTIEEIRETGTSTPKATSIKNITELIIAQKIHLEDLQTMPDSQVIKELTSIKGIGTWTAKMYLIFVLNRLDILPFEDGAFLQSYRWIYKTDDCSSKSVIKKCNKWHPYSSIAARYLYRALDCGLTKNEFHLFK